MTPDRRSRWFLVLAVLLLFAIITWLVTRVLANHWYLQAQQQLAAGNWSDARQQLRWASHLGDQSSMILLASECLAGKHGPRDRAEGEKWLLRCANNREAECMETLGILYWSGYGQPPDFERAKLWLERAVKAGRTEAATYLPMVNRRERRIEGSI